ncbi:MAG: hypothetical protein QUV05_02175 [Phycisphaerae bacterium]|nr:hypothetical protein [Phycisphaerae bacterium]
MDKITFACTLCGKTLNAPLNKAGKIEQCPNCNESLRIPIPANIQHCPHCGANQIKKASLVYEQGTSAGNLTGISLDDQGSLDVFGAGIKTKSLLATRLAPPSRPTITALVVSATFGIVFFIADIVLLAELSKTPHHQKGSTLFMIVMFGLVLAAMGIYFYIRAKRYPKEMAEYEYRFKTWDRLWVCLQCGKTWTSQ